MVHYLLKKIKFKLYFIKKVHYLSISKMPKFINLAKTGDDWVVVAGLVMNEDTDVDMMGLSFYQIEGEFGSIEDANMATKVVLDGVNIFINHFIDRIIRHQS